MSNYSRGFFLTDFIIASSILIIITCLSIKQVFFSEFYLLQEAKLLQHTLRCCGRIAQFRQESITVFLNPEEQSYVFTYGMYTKNYHKMHSSVCFGFLLDIPRPRGKIKKSIVNSSRLEQNNMVYTLTCFPSGSITPCSVYMTNKQRTAMVALTIGVGAYARVKLYHYKQANWQEVLL